MHSCCSFHRLRQSTKLKSTQNTKLCRADKPKRLQARTAVTQHQLIATAEAAAIADARLQKFATNANDLQVHRDLYSLNVSQYAARTVEVQLTSSLQ